MTSFSTDKQRDKVNAEWMSRPVDARQPLVLVLISIEQSLTFAYRLKRKLLSGLIFGGAYIPTSIRMGDDKFIFNDLHIIHAHEAIRLAVF